LRGLTSHSGLLPEAAPLHPGAQAAEQLVGNGAGVLRQLLCVDDTVPLAADEHRLVPHPDIFNAGDVQHQLVHTDPADALGVLSPDDGPQLSAAE
ncbi:DUF3848 domain-containing protein, partial [Dysosmobacter welbionis]